MRQRVGSSFVGKVFFPSDVPTRRDLLRIRSWLASPVRNFYLYGHGIDPGFAIGAEWGQVRFWPIQDPRLDRLERSDPATTMIVPGIVQSQYNFPMLDICWSAGKGVLGPQGGNYFDPQTSPHCPWTAAFQIGTNPNFASYIWGWNGSSIFNAHPLGGGGNTASVWLMWRKYFWEALGRGQEVYRAGNTATSLARSYQYQGPTQPWQGSPNGLLNWRAFQTGDITTTVP